MEGAEKAGEQRKREQACGLKLQGNSKNCAAKAITISCLNYQIADDLQ